MPQVSAADLRSAPSSTIARASIRRAAEPSFSRPAAARSSAAVKSTRVIATAPPIDVCSSLMSKHRVRVSSIWESQNESKAAAVGITYVNGKTIEWWDVPEPRLLDARDVLVQPLAVTRCDLDLIIVGGGSG